jgi:hypothetical protein|uniref:Uncharacterized protein n=1 Tax=Picea glauca TaxID=3330 RepID=A0A124GNB0_PICGL|nr:hypothetical protein ABT39_MTgene5261 [Picea glauca]
MDIPGGLRGKNSDCRAGYGLGIEPGPIGCVEWKHLYALVPGRLASLGSKVIPHTRLRHLKVQAAHACIMHICLTVRTLSSFPVSKPECSRKLLMTDLLI